MFNFTKLFKKRYVYNVEKLEKKAVCDQKNPHHDAYLEFLKESETNLVRKMEVSMETGTKSVGDTPSFASSRYSSSSLSSSLHSSRSTLGKSSTH